MKKLATLGLMIMIGFTTYAQTVQDFSLVNVLTGNSVSTSTYPSCSGLVIIFTSNTCPYDEYYRARINKLSRDYQEKVPVLLVNSGIDPGEANDAMVKKAQQAGISLPYLADKDQTLMNALGASKSASVYLLKNDGGKFSVVYKGAIDDNAQVEADVRHHYLKEAIDQLLAGQPIQTAEIRPVGCSIRKK
ncbi:redoxin family protein [Ohtaekwangia sp.]|uniref:redoxin family protein n=1 Tax=Ohtaekwangia sp. TaxID=2066019 RepID=UPI002F91D405